MPFKHYVDFHKGCVGVCVFRSVTLDRGLSLLVSLMFLSVPLSCSENKRNIFIFYFSLPIFLSIPLLFSHRLFFPTGTTHSKEVTKYLVTPSLQKSKPQSPGMSSTFHWLPPFSVRSQNSSCSEKEMHNIKLSLAALCIFCNHQFQESSSIPWENSGWFLGGFFYLFFFKGTLFTIQRVQYLMWNLHCIC